jgi:hypothetical protein
MRTLQLDAPGILPISSGTVFAMPQRRVEKTGAQQKGYFQ